jgi:prophage regulatory protein
MSFNEKELLRLRDLVQTLGLCKASIYNLIKTGDFPKQIKLTPSGRAVAWRSAEIQAWIESRPGFKS